MDHHPQDLRLAQLKNIVRYIISVGTATGAVEMSFTAYNNRLL